MRTAMRGPLFFCLISQQCLPPAALCPLRIRIHLHYWPIRKGMEYCGNHDQRNTKKVYLDLIYLFLCPNFFAHLASGARNIHLSRRWKSKMGNDKWVIARSVFLAISSYFVCYFSVGFCSGKIFSFLEYFAFSMTHFLRKKKLRFLTRLSFALLNWSLNFSI